MAAGAVRNLPSVPKAPGATVRFPLLEQTSQTTKVEKVILSRSLLEKFKCPDEGEKGCLKDPFTITANVDTIRENLQLLQRKGTINVRDLPGHYKSTYASREKAHAGRMRRFALEIEVEEKEKHGVHEDRSPMCLATGGGYVDKDGVKDYIYQRRQQFLLQYSLGAKEETIASLEQTVHKKQQQLIDDEKQLMESKLTVERLMMESQSRRTEAILRAEEETKEKSHRMAEVKIATDQLLRIKSCITKQQQALKECMAAKMIIDQLVPEEWREKKRKEALSAAEADWNESGTGNLSSYSLHSFVTQDLPFHKSDRLRESKSIPFSIPTASQSATSWLGERKEPVAEDKRKEFGFNDSNLEEEMYFKDPQEVLDIFFQLEEQNTSLFQTCNESEEDIECINQDFAATKERMLNEEARLRIKLTQEARQRILLLASQKASHKWLGRKLMYRSQPPEDEENGKLAVSEEVEDNEESDNQYFFT
ncbi:cilia- and flagella-associated protein 100-like isoform X2 [Heptranchias perlo]|uniref:cilia- and flagella-associated protein 100-like isoform X2 n=1 Tax=Heptranchias perlo TaxID=212740 RepID=UPI003559C454